MKGKKQLSKLKVDSAHQLAQVGIYIESHKCFKAEVFQFYNLQNH